LRGRFPHVGVAYGYGEMFDKQYLLLQGGAAARDCDDLTASSDLEAPNVQQVAVLNELVAGGEDCYLHWAPLSSAQLFYLRHQNG
jgi:hypothetical protein